MSKENVDALIRLNKVQEDEIRKLRAENRDLLQKIELLKKFSLLDALLR